MNETDDILVRAKEDRTKAQRIVARARELRETAEGGSQVTAALSGRRLASILRFLPRRLLSFDRV